jgi:hypothetical protein
MHLIESKVPSGPSRFQAGLQAPAGCRRYLGEQEKKSQLVVSHPVLVLIAFGLAAVILDVVAPAGLAITQTLLEICRMGLVAYQIFGR